MEKFDVYCPALNAYLVFMYPRDVCEAEARDASRRFANTHVYVVQADDTPVSAYLNGLEVPVPSGPVVRS